MIKYQIETTKVRPFTYKPPIIKITSDGELNLGYSNKINLYKYNKASPAPFTPAVWRKL